MRRLEQSEGFRHVVVGPDAQAAHLLRKDNYGNGKYDFSEGPLNELGESLLGGGKANEAVAVLELNAEFNAQSPWTLFLLGEAYRAAGQADKAKASYQKSLELDPRNPRAKARLDELARQ